MDSDDRVLLEACVRELLTLDEPMDLALEATTVFGLVAVLQLALRHRALPESSRQAAGRFVGAARRYFASCPSVLLAIERGSDPRYDRSPDEAAADEAAADAPAADEPAGDAPPGTRDAWPPLTNRRRH